TTHAQGHGNSLFFFFQAEDGIRDFHVTGVQTCALPISDENGSFRPSAYAPAITMIQRATPETSAGRAFPGPNACPDVAIPAFRAGARHPLCQRSAIRVNMRGKPFQPGELQGTDRTSAVRSDGV